MITGHPAFYAEAVPEVLVRVMANDPSPLSVYLNDPAPQLQQTFNWALEKNPEKRPSSLSIWLQQVLPLVSSIPCFVTGWENKHLAAQSQSPLDPQTPTTAL